MIILFANVLRNRTAHLRSMRLVSRDAGHKESTLNRFLPFLWFLDLDARRQTSLGRPGSGLTVARKSDLKVQRKRCRIVDDVNADG